LSEEKVRMVQPVKLMIAGAQKGGTSSLHYYLGQHPDVCTHKQLEMMYFAEDSIHKRGYQHAWDRYFRCEDDQRKIILAKNVGIMYLPQAMKRLYDHNQDVQLVISLRHPVDRAYSAYWYARQMGWEELLTFEDAINADPDRFANDQIRQRGCAYIDRSRYAKHLKILFQIFKREQVKIILFEDVRSDPINVCKKTFNSVGLDSSFVPITKQRKNPAALPRYKFIPWLMSSNQILPSLIRQISRQTVPDHFRDMWKMNIENLNKKIFSPPPMSIDTRERLIHYFKPHNVELSELINRDLSFWNFI
jgi:hypothetical protein